MAVDQARVERDGAEAVRGSLHAMWSSVAAWWGEHADYVDRRLAPVTDAMLELAAPAGSERVLELACGPGGVGLAASPLVGAQGEIVLSDIAVEMTSIAAARAQAEALGNVRTAELDLERIDEPDRSYDVVFARDGLQFAVDPAVAARETLRVLRPGGRACFAVWADKSQNPWLGLVLDAVGKQLGAPVPPPGRPGPFSLGSEKRLHAVLGEAGFDQIHIAPVAVPFAAASFDEWWAMVPGGAGPVAQILASLPDDVAARIAASARESAAPYVSSHGLELPGASLVARAVRP